MRRGVWVLVLLALLCLPSFAGAQPTYAPYDMALSIRYQACGEAQQALFDLVYDAVWEGKMQIDLPERTPYSDVTAVRDLLVQEAPELCAMAPTWNIWYYEQTPDTASGISVTYDLPVEFQQTLVDTARAMVSGLDDGEGDYARSLALHDLLCAHVTYDETGEAAHTAYGALAAGRAVCDGYAGAYVLLLRLSGISCSVVVGQVQDPATGGWAPHAWNVLSLSDAPLLTDVTADDQEDRVLHWYVNLPEQWMNRDHRPDAPADLPECRSMAWCWHIMNGSFVPAGQGAAAMREAFRQLARTGKTVDLRFESAEDFAAAKDVNVQWEAYNRAAAPEDRLYGQLSWKLSEAQQCLMLSLVP